MTIACPSPPRASWLRMPRRSARSQLTLLCGTLITLSGAALVAITYLLFERATRYRRPSLPTIPRTPAIQHLQHLKLLPSGALSQLASPPLPLGRATQGLADVQLELKGFAAQTYPGAPHLLAHIEQQLAQDQHQLTQAGDQLARD